MDIYTELVYNVRNRRVGLAGAIRISHVNCDRGECMQAPIALFVYNRIDHTKMVLQALNANEDIDQSELFIFSDAAADDTESANVAKVREYIRLFEHDNRFKKVTIIMAEENKGLEKSLIEGITQIIDQYGKIIVLEDDHLTSPDFIRFMNQALDFYENDQKIWSISGFTMDLKRLRHYKKDVFCGYRASCWGWASWKDRWDKVDWNVSDYDEFIHDRKRIREFNKGGIDMTPMLKAQHEGKIRSWAIRWCYQQYKEQMLTIFPKYSKVQNIGMDGSGTNSGSDSVYHATLKAETEWDFEYDEKDDRVYREWSDYYAKLLVRQKLGAIWYALTEYEYCLAYRLRKDEKYVVVNPNFKGWYCNAVPFDWKDGTYLFMVIYDKFKRKNSIGISRIEAGGAIGKPHKTGIRTSAIGIPCVFLFENRIYMMLISENEKEVRFYVMGDDITQWRPYCKVKSSVGILNAVVYNGADGKLYVLANEADKERRFQSRLILFQLEDLSHKKNVAFKELWRQNESSSATLGGGNIYEEGGRLYRIVRNGSLDGYSRFITLTEITRMDEQGYSEKISDKIGLINVPVKLTPFIYRKCGVYSYGKNASCEVACLWVQRFSVGGLFMKAYKLLPG